MNTFLWKCSNGRCASRTVGNILSSTGDKDSTYACLRQRRQSSNRWSCGFWRKAAGVRRSSSLLGVLVRTQVQQAFRHWNGVRYNDPNGNIADVTLRLHIKVLYNSVILGDVFWKWLFSGFWCNLHVTCVIDLPGRQWKRSEVCYSFVRGLLVVEDVDYATGATVFHVKSLWLEHKRLALCECCWWVIMDVWKQRGRLRRTAKPTGWRPAGHPGP